MTKVKVTYSETTPIKQKIYYDVHRVQMYPDGTITIMYWDHVREIMEVAIIKNRYYYEIEIF